MKRNKGNVPKIRFPGFTDEWEPRKLREVIEDYIEKTIVQNQYPVLTSSQQKGIIFQEEYFAGRQTTTDDNIGYFILPKGYFTYRSRSDNDIFIFNRNDLINKGIISYFYPVFQVKDVDSDFFLRRVNNGLQKEIIIAAEGTGQHVLSLKKFKNIIAMFPSEEEQSKIGKFFADLDNFITLHQRKLTHLQAQKKGLLQKMFPKEGERFPELRFPGFTEAWEVRKLGEVAGITMGQSPNGANYTDNPTDYILVQGNADMKNGRVTPRVWTTEITKTADCGDLILSVRAPVGDIGKTEYDVVLGRGVAGVKGNEFIYQTLLKMKEDGYWRILSTGSIFESINSNDIKEAKISIPHIEEQKEIGEFFTNFDNLITLYQNKLTHLRQQKKALLQQMFV